MKRLYGLILLFLSGLSSLYPRTITDMAGRTVEIPDKLERVFPYDPKTSILLFPLIGDKMAATSELPGKETMKYIAKDFMQLAVVDVNNIEEVILVSPQIIVSGFYNKNDNREPVFSLGKRLGIPVVLVDLSLDHLDHSYIFLGKLFGREKESKPLVSFMQVLYHQIDSLKAAHKTVTLSAYYTLGESGLLTDPSGSRHTEVFDMLAIPNAAKVALPTAGHVQVSMEQVLVWNPDIIFTASFRGENSAYKKIVADSKWSNIRAVKTHKVYRVPDQPIGWFDHPPSVNRVPGVIWLCRIFYGQEESLTMLTIRKFYQLFYKYNLTEAEYYSLIREA
jgi:iron complex transport system substrate-binding protein